MLLRTDSVSHENINENEEHYGAANERWQKYPRFDRGNALPTRRKL